MRYLAFYLPQFYPFPENDAWWGRGFTEWTNVTKAKPLFEGHYQPHLPSDLGFYDLRLREAQREQVSLAKAYGIDGFCFHYYWFDGKRLLDKPVDGFLSDPEIEFPFCLCFANESWTRRWDGAEEEILIRQSYRPHWERRFIESLVPYVQDDRYLRVAGKPLLLVYRPQHFPDPRQCVVRLREAAVDAGLGELHLCSALIRGNWDYEQFGFDSAVEFPPHNVTVPNLVDLVKGAEGLTGNILSFADIASMYLEREYRDKRVFRTVFPSWDNTARVNTRAQIVLDATPANFEIWLARATQKTMAERDGDEQIVFINAWNEWAEGCHLEPDIRFGRGYLAAVVNAKSAPAVSSQGQFDLSETVRLTGHSKIQTKGSSPVIDRIRLLLDGSPRVRRMAASVYRRTRSARHRLIRGVSNIRSGER